MAKKQPGREVIVKLIVGAGQASPSPPVGPALGSKGVKSMDFCKVRRPFHASSLCLSHRTPTYTSLTGIQCPHRRLHPRHAHTRPDNRPPRPHLPLHAAHPTHRNAPPPRRRRPPFQRRKAPRRQRPRPLDIRNHKHICSCLPHDRTRLITTHISGRRQSTCWDEYGAELECKTGEGCWHGCGQGCGEECGRG